KSISHQNRTEIQAGYAFAVACARARDRGMAEPDVTTFRAAWEKRSAWIRIGEFFSDAGQSSYRRSIIRRHEGRSVVSYAYLLGAVMCNPRFALSRLAGQF